MEPPSQNREYMINKIKQWLAVEQKIKELSLQLKQYRGFKKELNVDLLDIMKTNEIDCFDCQTGKITYTRNNVKKGINKKYLHSILNQYFGENTNQADDVCNFILDNRQVEVKENIKLKPNK